MSGVIQYESLSGYKYRLTASYTHVTGIKGITSQGARAWISLTKGGKLLFNRGYCWDGPSGPTIDTKNSMRASLVHDGIYQLIREGDIPRKKNRKLADKLLRDIAIADGMRPWRAKLWYRAVRWGALRSSYPGGGVKD